MAKLSQKQKKNLKKKAAKAQGKPKIINKSQSSSSFTPSAAAQSSISMNTSTSTSISTSITVPTPSSPPTKAPTNLFEVIDSDCAETPLIAYKHIAPLLKSVSRAKKKTPSTLNIYDPFYASPNLTKRLASIGFSSVYNRQEDFYDPLSGPSESDHDVTVTNPPYSGDHIENTFRYCVNTGKPWFILVPSWVYFKPWFKEVVGLDQIVFFVMQAEGKRYDYVTPQTVLSSDKNDRRSRTAPFMSMWYCSFGNLPSDQQQAMIQEYIASTSTSMSQFRLRVCSDLNKLPNDHRAEADPNRKRLSNKRRKKLKNLLKR